VRQQPVKTNRTLIGYARVSTLDQNPQMQIDALKRAGCHPDAIHVEKASGAALKRPVLDWALDELREGDTLVVWKLDRLARSVSELIARMEQIRLAGAEFLSLTEKIDTTTAIGKLYFHITAAFAEFERNLIRERTSAGVQAALERGQKFGPKRKLTEKQMLQAQKLRDQGLSLRAVAKRMGVSHTTIEDYTDGPRRRRKK
jgi:DNA invertase Pin-like site-specific DNA recombinase